jgi:hypothetical protein
MCRAEGKLSIQNRCPAGPSFSATQTAMRFNWFNSSFLRIIGAMRNTKLKTKPAANGKSKAKTPAKPKRAVLRPLATGQIWRVGEQNLQVGLIGKLLVHYKLAAPNAVRISNSVGGRTAVEKYLKTNRAVLLKTVDPETVKF